MLSIGEFSKICLVTTKTLRYYDEIGLIKPSHIDSDSGYRYYDISQLRTMLTINRLKSYEFSLEEIAEIIADPSDGLLLQKISGKERELELKKESYDFLLQKIKEDIQNLEQGVSIMSYLDNLEVKLVERMTVNVVSARQIMRIDEFEQHMRKLCARIDKEKLTVTGGPIAIYYEKEFNPLKCDVELAVPVKEVVTGTRDLPGGLCATLTLKGPYSELPGCYAKLMDWTEKEGYELTAPPYEVYLTDPKDTKPEDHITEIYFPVKKK